MPGVQHMGSLEESVIPQLTDSKNDSRLIIGNERTRWFAMNVYELIEHSKQGLCGLVDYHSDSCQQQPQISIVDSENSHPISLLVVRDVPKQTISNVERQHVPIANIVLPHFGRRNHYDPRKFVRRFGPPFHTVFIMIFFQPLLEIVKTVRLEFPEAV
jgi:hypothetical protein